MIDNLAQRAVLAVIRAYQLLLSPMFAGSCRFVPSCSQYAADAVSRFGAIKGTWLALRRLSRCHPFGGHGVDPVPAFAPSGLPPLLELRRTSRRGTPEREASGSKTTL